jgi:uncharacterized protein (DUF302 family)
MKRNVGAENVFCFLRPIFGPEELLTFPHRCQVGRLCKIDIQAKLKEKLGIEFPRYVILGACNPALAYRALRYEIDLGLLLPCNGVVYERDGQVFAGVVDAAKMLSIIGNPVMEEMAQEVNERLRRAVSSVARG